MVTEDDEGARVRAYILGMTLWRRIRAIEPWRLDVLVALVFLVEAEPEVLLLMDAADDAWIAALLQVVLAAGLGLRRPMPALSLTPGLAAFVAFQPLSLEVNDNIVSAFFAVLFLLFSFGLHERDGRLIVAGMASAFVANGVSQAIDRYPSTVIDYFTGGVIIACGPILLGRVIHSRS